jgi:hypothetical protein
MPKLKTVITTSKQLKAKNFSVVHTSKIEVSWGVVAAYIHVQKTNNH